MKSISSFFLRAKHWQMFLLVFGGLSVVQIAGFTSLVSSTSAAGNIGQIGFLIAGLMVIVTVCFLAWFWSMGSFLNSIVRPDLKMSLGFFRFALVFPAIYIPVFVFMMFSQESSPKVFAVIMPLHFLAMYCLFYLLYFVSKSIVLAETSETAVFYNYAGPFFLLWFYPIGIWIIQPRINRLYAEHGNVKTPFKIGSS